MLACGNANSLKWRLIGECLAYTDLGKEGTANTLNNLAVTADKRRFFGPSYKINMYINQQDAQNSCD